MSQIEELPDSSRLERDSNPLPGYRLIEALGKGGFGEVWKAEGPGGFKAALKFVDRERGAAIEQRSLDIIKHLRHPNLLTTFGAWLTSSHLIIAMELADGSLASRLKEARQKEGHPGIPGAELLEYMSEAAKGVDYLNSHRHDLGDGKKHGIQHRDLKPENILLAGGGVKVADFGLSRRLEANVTGHTGSFTLLYAAPEFFGHHTFDQSDQYSLGVTYCVLRGGQPPFQGSLEQLVASHLYADPDLSMLPEAERPIVARALSKNPHERWLNCRAFVDAIRAVLTSPRTIDQSVNDFAEIEPNLTSYLIEQDDKSEEHVDSISTKFSDDFSIVTVAPFESPLSTLPENEVEPPQWSIEDPWDMAGHRRPVQRESQDRHSQPMNQLLSDLPARKNSLAWRFKLGLVVVLAMIGEAGLAVSRLSKKLSTRIIATGTLLIICGGLLTINRLGSPSGNPARLAAEKPIAKPEPDPRMRLTTEAIVKRMGPKVARIKGQWGVGSGFLIRPGILVTNAHVVDDELASDLEVFFPSAATDQGPFKGQLIYEDEKRDLAFLKLTATTESLSMARDFTFRSGMDVTVIGSFGLGSGDKILVDPFSRGILIAKTTVDGQPFFQLSASIHGGNSGGPVFDDYGDVIGVATATFRGKEGPGLCIPIEDLAEAVERVASQTQAEADNASNRHHLQTVSRLLSLYTLRFVEGLQIYDALMVNAVKEKESPSNGINKAASIVDPRLVKFIRLYEERLKNEITAISSNSSTPPLVSKHLVELFSTYSEMKRTIDSPPSDSNAFHQKVRELIDDRRIHVEALQIFLNFTDEPDLFQDVFKDFFDKPK